VVVDTIPEYAMFPPAQVLEPLRVVAGTRNARYDCPDLFCV
jgi:hypothetical protein